MFNILCKLSGKSHENHDVAEDSPPIEVNHSAALPQRSAERKKAKQHRSRASSGDGDAVPDKEQKRKKFVKQKQADISSTNPVKEEGKLIDSEDESTSNDCDTSTVESSVKLPPETPDWGIKLLEIIQNEFRNVSKSISAVEKDSQKNSKTIKDMEKKLAKVELRNKSLEDENVNLKEKLLDLRYHQCRNNLLFEGVADAELESDAECIAKLRNIPMCIPGLDQNFVIDRCYRIDGPFRVWKMRRVICAFNWHVDVQFVLRNRKHLPSGIFVHEDLPEEWIDR